ncbi:MAG TPA: AMP-binding protein [Terriglobales bacterium]|nr:AMP-binding protein [Terriglobales bacterium]
MALALERELASVGRLIEAQAEQRADATAVAGVDGPALTYEQLDRHVRGIADGLRAAGVRREDRVAVVAPNGPAMAVAFLGVASTAACAPLNPGYTAAELAFYLDDLSARAVIVPAGMDSPVRDVARARGVPVLDLTGFALDAGGGAPAPDAGPRAEDIALVLHTSGTTSRPKIIPLSQANLCASARNIAATLRLGADDCCLNVMPLFHIHGLIGALLSSLTAGASVVCTTGFSPVRFFAWLDQFAPTWYTAVPTMHQEVLARADAHREAIARGRLRFVRSASSALAPEVMAGLERAFGVPVVEAYGMTEAAHQIASNPLPPGTRKPGSVGRPAGCEVTILDADGRALAPGETGEIAIRGASVTAARFAPQDPGDAWLRTGDVGYVDADGYVFIAGRVKEIINRGGEKISPREVDEVLLQHPAVAQAVTCAMPDPRLGEDVLAIVVTRPGASVTERELRDFASTHLAAFKVPRRVKFLDEIPKGPTGKVQRIGLAARLGLDAASLAQPSGTVAYEAPATESERVLAEIWADILKVERVGLQDNFFELGGDSLASMEVVAAVDARLGAAVGVRELAFGTLQQVAAACDEARTAPRDEPDTSSFMSRIWTRWRRRA